MESTKLAALSYDAAADSSVKAAYTSSGQKKRGTSTLSWCSVAKSAQQPIEKASTMPATAIESCRAPTKTSRPITPASSTRSRGGAPAAMETVLMLGHRPLAAAAAVVGAARRARPRGAQSVTCPRERTLGHGDDLLWRDLLQAPEVARRAHALVARTAR